MPDRIRIHDLRLCAVIGVDEHEREGPQEIRVSLDLETDLRAPAETDSLEDALDYRALAEQVSAHVEGSRFRLIERLAATTADRILGAFPAVSAVTIKIEKPAALPLARTVAVELRRERPKPFGSTGA